MGGRDYGPENLKPDPPELAGLFLEKRTFREAVEYDLDHGHFHNKIQFHLATIFVGIVADVDKVDRLKRKRAESILKDKIMGLRRLEKTEADELLYWFEELTRPGRGSRISPYFQFDGSQES